MIKSTTITNLSGVQIDNLFKLCKVWGFLKYFHPAVAKGSYDWDAELFKLLPEILHGETPDSADAILIDLVRSMGDISVFDDSEPTDTTLIKMTPDIDWLYDSNFLTDELISLLDRVKRAKKTGPHHYIEFEWDEEPTFKNELEYADFEYTENSYMLLSLFRYWNIVEYFFPYKYLMDENWNHVLQEYIPKIIECRDAHSYHVTINEITCKICDDHASPPYSSKWSLLRHIGSNKLPVNFHLVQGETVITEIHPSIKDSTKLELGDVVTKLDGVDINVKRAELEEFLKPKSRVHPNYMMNTALSYCAKDSVEISVQRNGESIKDRINTFNSDDNTGWEQKESHQLLHGNIGYIYPGSLEKDEIKSIMEKFKDTNGLIVDLRCYPSEFIVFSLGNYLVPTPTDFTKCTTTSIKNPGTFIFEEPEKVGMPQDEKYNKSVIVIINEDSISQPEYTAMAFRVSPNVTVIGDNSMGADGDVSTVLLPGGIETNFSGIGIYYPDGRETQRIGIIPDIYVKPTIKGIQAGHDELLDKAIELLQK